MIQSHCSASDFQKGSAFHPVIVPAFPPYLIFRQFNATQEEFKPSCSHISGKRLLGFILSLGGVCVHAFEKTIFAMHKIPMAGNIL